MADMSSNFQGKLPPQNLVAEQSVLGSILLHNESLDEVADFLQATHFYSEKHQLIYGAIYRMSEAGVRGIDAVTLSEELDARQQLADVGGVPYILEILAAVPMPPTSNITPRSFVTSGFNAA